MRSCKILWELPKSIRTVTGRLLMRPVNLRVFGERVPFRACGDRWKWIMSYVGVNSRVSSAEAEGQSGLSRSKRNLELEHLWPG